MIRQLKKVLTTHLAEQESLKSLIGVAWENPDFIFTNEFGEFIDPNLVSAWFRQTRKKAGIKRKVTLHNVRHYYSSFLSSQGISNKTISALLGHTDESFSYDTYIHALDEETKKAARIFEEALDKHFETEPPTHNINSIVT